MYSSIFNKTNLRMNYVLLFGMNVVHRKVLRSKELSKVGYLPKLSTDLIATLSSLDMKNFSHGLVNSDKRTTSLIVVCSTYSGCTRDERFGFIKI